VNGDVVRGTVKRFNPKRGYGFIQITGESSEDDDVFVHQSDIDIEGFRSLNVGEEVELELEITASNELKARHVKLLSKREPYTGGSAGGSQGPRTPLVDAGQRALVRVERLECQFKKLVEILARDVEGDVVLSAGDIQEIYTAISAR